MFFVSNAYAQSGANEPNPLFTFLMFGGLFLFMYLFIIRPQKKRQNHKQLKTKHHKQ